MRLLLETLLTKMDKTGERLYGCLHGSYIEGRQRRVLSWGCLKTGIQILNKGDCGTQRACKR